MKNFRTLASAAVLACNFLLASCGGGGGGPADSGGTPVTVINEVSINLVSPAAVNKTTHSGQAMTQQIELAYTGNESVLAGKIIYGLAVMPDPIFTDPLVVLNPSTKRVSVTLNGRLDIPAGRYTGTLKLYACLDTACSTQLGNSPLSLPYDITIKQGLTVSASTLNLSTPFGTTLPSSTITVTLPEGATAFNLISIHDEVKKVGNAVVVTPDPLAMPGTYNLDVILTSTVSDAGAPGGSLYFQKNLTIRVVVAPSAVPFVSQSPAQSTFTFALNDVTGYYGGSLTYLVSQDPAGSFERAGFRYDTNPAGANGHARVNLWLSWSDFVLTEYVVSPCSSVAGSPDCLPAGDYTGAALFRHRSGTGVVTEFEVPVAMRINP